MPQIPEWVAGRIDPALIPRIVEPGTTIKVTVELHKPPSMTELSGLQGIIGQLGARVTGASGRYLFVMIDEEKIPQLAALPQVKYVHRTPPAARLFTMRPAVEEALEERLATSLTNVEAYLKIDRARQLGYTGRDIKVAVVDSGIDDSSSIFNGKIVASMKFIGADPSDRNGHGTHLASTILTLAPGAQLVNAKCFEIEEAYMDTVMMALNWASQNADILNCSWGGEYYAPLHGLIQDITAQGKIVVAAVGNWELSCPGCLAEAVSVGSVGLDDRVSEFSGRGPSPINRHIEPDIVTPGENIEAIGLGGEPLTLSGTSMSTSVASAVTAIISEASISRSQVLPALYYGARKLGSENKSIEYGYGVADTEKSVQLAASGQVLPDGEQPPPDVIQLLILLTSVLGLLLAWR